MKVNSFIMAVIMFLCQIGFGIYSANSHISMADEIKTVVQEESVCAILDRLDADSTDMNQPIFSLVSDLDKEQTVAIIRISLPGGISAKQVKGAFLKICIDEGDAPYEVDFGVAKKTWSLQNSSWNKMRDAVVFSDTKSAEYLGDNWYQYEVTDIVQGWLFGDMANYGFAMAYLHGDGNTKFYTGVYEDASKHPKLVIIYNDLKSTQAFGKYDFSQQIDGNCFSYAFRDVDPVYGAQLISDPEAFEMAIAKGEGVQYFSELVVKYVNLYKDQMSISGIRVIEEHEEIDVDNEYRVAMRLGFHDRNGIEGIQVFDRDFDYHFRVQLRDGSWAEKFPMDPSRIVPGTNKDNDLCQFPWDSSYMMGFEKWNEYYDSEVVYYAVTKTTDSFTAHLGENK